VIPVLLFLHLVVGYFAAPSSAHSSALPVAEGSSGA
jgi:hypothetical protein